MRRYWSKGTNFSYKIHEFCEPDIQYGIANNTVVYNWKKSVSENISRVKSRLSIFMQFTEMEI